MSKVRGLAVFYLLPHTYLRLNYLRLSYIRPVLTSLLTAFFILSTWLYNLLFLVLGCIIITVQTSIMSMMYKVIYLFILTNKLLNSSIVFTVDKLSGRLFHSLIADGKKEYL